MSWQLASEASDGIFDAAFFPRASGVTEVAAATECGVDCMVESELGSIIAGDRLAYGFGEFSQGSGEGFATDRPVLSGWRRIRALRDVRSGATRMNWLFCRKAIRSASQFLGRCPGAMRAATSAGRWSIET